MKIVFICSSLEPGRDGVGDYVRLLASQLKKIGWHCAAIAINDQFVASVSEKVQTTPFGDNLVVLRISSTLQTNKKFEVARDWIVTYNPQWISLQYVGFGFHTKGLPFDMVNALKSINGNFKLHVMFHELWCGMTKTAGIKERILGKLQKRFIKWMIAFLKPAAIFTNLESYAGYLKQINVAAVVAPIFSNITINEQASDNDWQSLVDFANIKDVINNKADWLIFGFFGTVYAREGLKELIGNAAEASRQVGKKFGILAIGHGRGLDADVLIDKIHGARFWRTGAISPGLINKAIAIVDLGVVTSTADGINKSGAAVAWLERGVPILISGEDRSYQKETMMRNGVYQVLNPADIIEAIRAKGNFLNSDNLDLSAKAYVTLANS